MPPGQSLARTQCPFKYGFDPYAIETPVMNVIPLTRMALECGREDAGYGPESDRNLQGVKNSTTMVCQLLDENKKGKL